jgi:3-hydroxyisobutyrate dehydrogenase-like beta-hydroxyacid dehydrogenase
MGGRMAAHLLHRENQLIVFNRTRAKAEPLRKQGARLAESPAELATEVDVLFTMLSQPEAVEQVALGSGGFLDQLRPNKIWIDCSTVNPSFSKRLAAEAARRSIRFLDAPVTGSAPIATEGQLSFWVGGDSSDLEEVQPLLSEMGSRTVHVGPNGAGSAMKLVINLLLGTGMAAFAEAMALGESFGLNLGAMFDELAGMPQVPPFVLSKREKIENGDYRPEFQLVSMQKDLHLASVSAYETGVALPVTNSAKEIYRLAIRSGRANQDFSAIYDYLTNTDGRDDRGKNSASSAKPVASNQFVTRPDSKQPG